MAKFTIVTKIYQDYSLELAGISEDTYIDLGAPTTNYGTSGVLLARKSVDDHHILLHIRLPMEEDIPGFHSIEEVFFEAYGAQPIPSAVSVGAVAITEWWKLLEATWEEAQSGVVWVKGDGAITSRTAASDSSEEIKTSLVTNATIWHQIDITGLVKIGETASIVLYISKDISWSQILFDSTRTANVGGNWPIIAVDQAARTFTVAGDILGVLSLGPFTVTGSTGNDGDYTWYSEWLSGGNTYIKVHESIPSSVVDGDFNDSSCKPKLVLRYRDYPPEAFLDKDSALTIEPNPNNPEQPLLKWGGVKDADFVDFKVYRETSAITTVAALTPIATITSPADQEYIDDGSLPNPPGAFVDGTTYYYLVIAEDGNNTLDDSTFSNQIAWTKPNMSARTIATAGISPIGTTKTVSVTSGNNIKKLYVDWGDGCTSWYEYETVGLTKTATHIYSKVLGSVGSQFAAEVQVEDEDGFWSDALDTTTTIYTTGSDSEPKLRVNVKKGQLGDYVTLDASLSQPDASNVTITKYEFKRDAADAWQDNGAVPVYTFKTGTGGGEYPQTIGVKVASLRTTTSLGTVSSSTTASYELETGTATPLVFSRDTKIHELNHDLSLDKLVEVPIGSDRTSYEFLISRPPERVTLVGTSNHPHTGTDIAIIRAAWLANTFVSFTVNSEMEGKVVTYEGKIDGDISLGQAYNNKQSWTFPLRVITRTEA